MAQKAKSLNFERRSGFAPGAANPARRGGAEGRPYHHGNLRAALIDAAVTLVDLHGSEALSLRETARRAGVSQTAPYRHFADRSALVAAVAADGFLMLIEDLAHASDATRAQATADRIAALTRAYVRFARENRGRFIMMFEARLPSENEDLAQARAALADQLGDALGLALARDAWPAMHGRAALALAGLAREDS